MVKTTKVVSKFMELIEYAIHHAPILKNHKEFGEGMRDVRYEIAKLEETNTRLILAASGRGIVSEMENMKEIAVLVCGLHDKILILEAEAQKEKYGYDEVYKCPYCKDTGKGKMNGVEVRCLFCG